METQVMADDHMSTRGGTIMRYKARVRHDGLVPTLTPVYQQRS
jgi:hypothetical protein